MNQIQKLIIFMLLFEYINTTCNSQLDEENGETVMDQLGELGEYSYSDPNASTSKCKKREISSYEKQDLEAYKCCYIKAKCKVSNFFDEEDEEDITNLKDKYYNVKACTTVSSLIYKNLKEYVKLAKAMCSEYKIDCFSSYLKLMFISFISILL